MKKILILAVPFIFCFSCRISVGNNETGYNNYEFRIREPGDENIYRHGFPIMEVKGELRENGELIESASLRNFKFYISVNYSTYKEIIPGEIIPKERNGKTVAETLIFYFDFLDYYSGEGDNPNYGVNRINIYAEKQFREADDLSDKLKARHHNLWVSSGTGKPPRS